LRPAQAKNRRTYLKKKKTKAKRAGSVAQVVECLPSKGEALCLNTSTKTNQPNIKSNIYIVFGISGGSDICWGGRSLELFPIYVPIEWNCCI
jgi:hypothetical protein